MFTFEPARSLLPGAGFCEMTRPFFTLAEKAFLTFPTEQCARLIAVLAAASFLPFPFGTTHFFWDGGGGSGGGQRRAVGGGGGGVRQRRGAGLRGERREGRSLGVATRRAGIDLELADV